MSYAKYLVVGILVGIAVGAFAFYAFTQLSQVSNLQAQIEQLQIENAQLKANNTALLNYLEIMGYINATTNKVGKAMQIQSISRTNVFVQNVGDSDIVLSSLYVNGVLDSGAVFSKTTLKPAETVTITPSNTFVDQQVTVKVVSEDGTFAEYTKTFP